MNTTNHPKLIGRGENIAAELNSIQEVAAFIIEHGMRGNVQITYDDGRPFLDTFGIFINKIADMAYREKLLEILIPMQLRAEQEAFGCAEEPPLRELTQDEVDVMCAKHVLWLQDAGGEQANFSGCKIKGIELLHRNLMNAVLSNAVFSACDLSCCELIGSNCAETVFEDCTLDDIAADDADFSSAELKRTSMKGAFICHADFYSAAFKSCNLDSAHLQNCCFDTAEFENTDLEMAYVQNPSYNHAEWSGDVQPVMGEIF